MHDQQMRDEQRQFAKRQEESGNMGGTLRTRPGFNRNKSQKVMPKGHEAFLKALETSSAIVSFEKVSSGERIEGVVKHSDKYTVSVEISELDGGTRTRVLFKHDISEFSAITAPKTGDESDLNAKL